MGQRSKIAQLPPELKEWLDDALVKGNFSRYEQRAAELKARGADISKSGLHRYGTNLERRLGAIKASTEAARLIDRAAPDDEDQRSGAIISMIQTDMFNILLLLQESEAEKDPLKRAKLISAVAKNMATLTRASIFQKRHQTETRSKAKTAADAAAKIAQKGGLSKSAVESIRSQILGIAQ